MSNPHTHELVEDVPPEANYNLKPFANKNKDVMRKLLYVFLLAALFMTAEIIGGIVAGSIAIMSDAAHMFSDLLGFIISIVSVWISGFPANKKHSYGFHRAGVIGALGSVLVIWILTGCLMYFAVQRLIHINEVEVQGKVMFVVACLGLVMNLIMVKILHGDHGHGHSHCGHSHSHGHSHGHAHSHEHEHHHDHDHNHKHAHDHDHDHDHKEHSHKHDAEHDRHHYHAEKESHDNHHHEHYHHHHNENHENHEHHHSHDHEKREHHEHHEHSHQEGHNHSHRQMPPCEGRHPEHKVQKYEIEIGPETAYDQVLKHLENDGRIIEVPVSDTLKLQINKHVDHNNEVTADADATAHTIRESLSNASHHDNLNVRATIIHIIGDILQSIGVIIASILIWVSPEKMKIADPILTFLFAFIVLLTTIRVARDCIIILMEGTPMELDLEEFENTIRKLDGVSDVHDLHVWSLGIGKPAMSAHIFTPEEIGRVLKKTTEVCRKYGIYHSTIQIEVTQDRKHHHYIDCKHDIH